MNKKQMRLYAAAKAAVTRESKRKMETALENMQFLSCAAIKATHTRRINMINRQFGVKSVKVQKTRWHTIKTG